MSSPPTFWQRIAAEVRAEMARQHKTGIQLSKILHLSRNSVYRRLNGQIPFDLEELEVVSEWLDTDVGALGMVT